MGGVGSCARVGRGLGVPISPRVGVAVTRELHGLSSSGKKEEESEELGYGALYGNIVTLPNGLNVAVPV